MTDPLSRRGFHRLVLGSAAAASLKPAHAASLPRMPVGFVGHGAPTLALDTEHGHALAQWYQSLPSPTAILVVSAHWLRAPVSLTTGHGILHDFHGFPEALYRMTYDPPPATDLQLRIESLLADFTPTRRDRRPLDHGVWTPLVHMVPDARVPVLQLSMPMSMSADALYTLGTRLTPLRHEGVWILGSGSLVHNLRRIDWSNQSPPPSWAIEFDEWTTETLSLGGYDHLVNFAVKAPAPHLAHPTIEHFLPLIVAAGAAGTSRKITFPSRGFELGNISRRSVDFRD